MTVSSALRWLRTLVVSRPQRPLLISIDVSDRCDLRCAMCRAWRRGPRAEVMDVTTFASVLRGLGGLEGRELVLIGAEPTLNPALVHMVAAATAAGFATRLFSNGARLDRDMAEELARAGLGSATISIDAASPATHDHLRGVAGAHARAVGAIRALRAAPAGCRVAVSTNTLVTTTTLCELQALVGLARDAGATRHAFQIPSQVPAHLAGGEGLSQQYRESDSDRLLFQPQQLPELRATLAKVARSARSPSAAILAGLPDEAFLEARFPHARCRYAGIALSIDSAGNAYPCSHFHGTNLGAVAARGWQGVWRGQERQAFLHDLARGLHEVCRYCCHTVHNLSAGRLAQAALLARRP